MIFETYTFIISWDFENFVILTRVIIEQLHLAKFLRDQLSLKHINIKHMHLCIPRILDISPIYGSQSPSRDEPASSSGNKENKANKLDGSPKVTPKHRRDSL